eukprot:TRINITY_DN8728_c0_g1_i1.p1 TRINITY_DN8728_c0_g1~~TRINITY_DN8728_c0_g1_i1.p1  ORF type:complete len:438 (+),score=47.67 TRINITY_DN8728_c0_g1_i1:74-1315(+)
MEELPVRSCKGPLYSGHDQAYAAMTIIGFVLVIAYPFGMCLLVKFKSRMSRFVVGLISIVALILFLWGVVMLAGGIWHLIWMRKYKYSGCGELVNVTFTRPLPEQVILTPVNLTVAYLGDTGVSEDTLAVYQLIKDEEAEMMVHVGDFDYCDDPTLFHRQLDAMFGEKYPILAVVGNHDVHMWSDYQEMWLEHFNRHANNPSPYLACEGYLGVNYYCIYRGLFFAFSSVGTMCGDGYSEYEFHEKQLQHNLDARSQLPSADPWTMCAWHKNQKLFQIGKKSDETGYGVYDICRQNNGLVVTGHNHQYSRTHTISNVEDQTIAAKCEPGDEDCVYDLNEVALITVSGLGGRNLIDFNEDLENLPFWAAKYNEAFGVMFCKYNFNGDPNMAYCYFKDVEGGIHDEFRITKNVESK